MSAYTGTGHLVRLALRRDRFQLTGWVAGSSHRNKARTKAAATVRKTRKGRRWAGSAGAGSLIPRM